MKVRKVRDLTLITLHKDQTMVVACDSCGGIGLKAGDILKVPPIYVGSFTARVVIMEVMCSGAEIVTVTNAVCNEMEPTGREIIKGIQKEVKAAGIDEIVLTGSTEENFSPPSTGVGITAIGIADNKKLKINNIEEALIVSVGIPKVGEEIDLEGDREIIDYGTIKTLLEKPWVYEIVPVGSKGIVYEAEQLAVNNRLELILENDINVDIRKSAGPATCIIAAINREYLETIMECQLDVNVIGSLRKA